MSHSLCRSRSSVGERVRLITVRSAVQARVGAISPNGEIGQACAAEVRSLTHATLEQSHFKKWAHTSGELGDVNPPFAQSTKLTPDSLHQNECAETRDRTGDLQIFSLKLPQLSYRGDCQ